MTASVAVMLVVLAGVLYLLGLGSAARRPLVVAVLLMVLGPAMEDTFEASQLLVPLAVVAGLLIVSRLRPPRSERREPRVSQKRRLDRE